MVDKLEKKNDEKWTGIILYADVFGESGLRSG